MCWVCLGVVFDGVRFHLRRVRSLEAERKRFWVGRESEEAMGSEWPRKKEGPFFSLRDRKGVGGVGGGASAGREKGL